MRAYLLIAAVLTTTGGAPAADTYTCRSLDETDFPVTASFDLEHGDDDGYTVPRAQMQIEGDMGYSTTPDHPGNGAFVSVIEVGNGSIRLVFHQTYDEYDVDVAELHVVTLSEGVYDLTAGVLQIGGGGLWPIQCDIAYEHPRDH
jgi:hypothetical protein